MVKYGGTSQSIKDAPLICRRVHPSHSPGIFYGQNPLKYSFTLMLIEVTLIILIIHSIRFLLRPLKQPRIVSEILGGIVIGPSVLGRNKWFAASMFPDDVDYAHKLVGLIGFIYFLFLCGVKMDLMVIKKAGKKQWWIAVFGVAVPFVITTALAFAIRKSFDKELQRIPIIGGITSALSITSFPVLHPIIKELNLLSSEIGRQALSTVIISDVIGLNCLTIFEAARTWEEAEAINVLWYVMSIIGILVVVGVIRLAMTWIVKATPVGKPVEQTYVVAILVAVMVVGFLSDITGVALANGPLWLGLAVPDGPPLGATLVDRAETIITELFMPFSFAYVGMYTDVSSMCAQWSRILPLFGLVLTAYVTKIVTTLLVLRFFRTPLKESMALSLILSLRGQVEILLYLHWMDLEVIEYPHFTLLVLATTAVTFIVTPLIGILYDPNRPYMVNKRRAIQFTPSNAELHIVACIHDQESVAGFTDLLEASNPTVSSPFSVYALRLIELVGRASPVFIDHENQAEAFEHTSYNPIHHALTLFQETRGEYIRFHLFTSVSPARTMYQDICELALSKKAILIILPFKKDYLDTRTEVLNDGMLHLVNPSVLAHAPCSVGIFIDRGRFSSHLVNYSKRRSNRHFVVLFLGGPDAREALAYADRMAGNPDLNITVIRFLSCNGEGDNEFEKKLDDGLVTWFWVKNEANESVIYREVVVKNGEETIGAIQSLSDVFVDLWIVGRKNGINSVLLRGLSNWSQNNALGVIGDYIATMDIGSRASILVVQQQVLREHEGVSAGLLRIFSR